MTREYDAVQIRWIAVEDARRRRDVARRAVLHTVARLARCAPGDVRVRGGPHGKPLFGDARTGAPLYVNASYAGGFVLVGFSNDRELGVDVELIDARADLAPLLDRFGSDAERAEFAAVPAELRRTAEYAWWTRKEAFTKATGLGLSVALDSFDVSLDPRIPASIGAIRDPNLAARPWTIAALDAPTGYAAALVAHEVRR